MNHMRPSPVKAWQAISGEPDAATSTLPVAANGPWGQGPIRGGCILRIPFTPDCKHACEPLMKGPRILG